MAINIYKYRLLLSKEERNQACICNKEIYV